MAKELIAFLNFEFRQNPVNIKSVSGETMTEVPRFVINWRDYQALLGSLGLKYEVQDRPLFRRYLSYLSSEDLYNDLIAFQEELRRTLIGVIETGTVPAAVWKRVFKDTNGLPMFIAPEGEGDWSPSADMSFHYDFSADTYRLFVLAMVRGLILDRRIFSLTVDDLGRFDLPEDLQGASKAPLAASPDMADAPTAAERHAALRTAVARELPAALSRAVAEKLPAALAESAAEKLPVVMDALVKVQLPEALSAAVDERVGAALAEAVELDLPEALNRAVAERLSSDWPEELAKAVEAALPEELAKAVEAALPEKLEKEERVEEITPFDEDEPLAESAAEPAGEAPAESLSIIGSSAGPSFSLAVPGLRLIGRDSSISVPLAGWPAVNPDGRAIPDESEESEDEDIWPRDLDASGKAASDPADEALAAEEPDAGETAGDFIFLGETLEAPEGLEPEPSVPQGVQAGVADEPASFSMADLDAVPAPGGDVPDFNPREYAETYQEALEEDFLLDAPGPALEHDDEAVPEAAVEISPDGCGYIFRPAQAQMAGFVETPDSEDDREDDFIEPDDEDIEDIEPAEDILADEEEPLVLSDRLEEDGGRAGPPPAEAGEIPAEEAGPVSGGDEGGESAAEARVEADGGDDDGWLPFLKVPSKKKAGKVPLEQRLATLEHRRKRRSENDDQDKFDF